MIKFEELIKSYQEEKSKFEAHKDLCLSFIKYLYVELVKFYGCSSEEIKIELGDRPNESGYYLSNLILLFEESKLTCELLVREKRNYFEIIIKIPPLTERQFKIATMLFEPNIDWFLGSKLKHIFNFINDEIHTCLKKNITFFIENS